MPKKLTKEIVNGRLRANGRDIRLTGSYINANTKSEFECGKGHKWLARPGCVMNGDGCPHCSCTARLSKEIVNERLRLLGTGIVLVGDYISALTKSEFKCSNGHFWFACPSNVMRGHGCRECLKMTEEMINHKISVFGISLSGTWNGANKKSRFRCNNGHVWFSYLSNIMRGNGCPYCNGNAHHTKESINNILDSQKRGIRQIDECERGKSRNMFMCASGHTWLALPYNILVGKGCPHCHGLKDCIYIWKSVGELFNGKNVYKIGITKSSKGRGRIKQCATASGRKPKILCLEKVKDAASLEREILNIGEHPDYLYKFDGYTEMRAFDGEELAIVLKMIDENKETKYD